MLQEAAQLSSLKPQLEQLQVPLFAVVKEDVGTEVQNFRTYFKGEEIFLDEKVGGRSGGSLFFSVVSCNSNDRRCCFCHGSPLQRRFYGPRERRMGLLGFLRLGVWFSGLRAFRHGFMGNVLGEGFILGGVYVIGRGRQVKSSSVRPAQNVVGSSAVTFVCSDRGSCWSTERLSSETKSTWTRSSELPGGSNRRSFSSGTTSGAGGPAVAASLAGV